jgi:hypothetical protein
VVEEMDDHIKDLEAEKIIKMREFFIKPDDNFDYFMTYKK